MSTRITTPPPLGQLKEEAARLNESFVAMIRGLCAVGRSAEVAL